MDTNIQVHLLPCSITVPDGVAEANVSKYFEPTIQSSSVHSSLGKEGIIHILQMIVYI